MTFATPTVMLEHQMVFVYDVSMRTTVTIDPDVERRIKDRMAREKLSMKQVINEGLRRGLTASPVPEREPFRVEPHSFGLRPGIDQDKLNQLADELDVLEFAARTNAGDR